MTSDSRPGERSDESTLLASAKRGDGDALQRLTEPHRRELLLHCYQMLGSFHDAEDLVQETFLRAWRGLEHFDGRAAIRYWLYRIATNVCLTALATRQQARRVLPETHGPPSDRMPDREPAHDIAWLEPYPDSALEGIVDHVSSPDARYEMREAVHLAFIAAIQLLPPRQRAVLLLRDVLGLSAAEAARLVGRVGHQRSTARPRDIRNAADCPPRQTVSRRLPSSAAGRILDGASIPFSSWSSKATRSPG